MKKFKLLTLGLLTLIGLGSFCNSSQLSVVYDSVSNSPATGTISVNGNYVYCFYANYNTSTRKFNITYQGITVNVPISSNMICFGPDSNYNSFDYEFIGSSYNVLNYIRIYEAEICDYSDYVPITDYNTCLSDLNTATGNYLSCQTNVSGYLNSLNNCSSNLNSCNTSLSSCLSANCPVVSNSWSALFVNTEQLTGAGIINIDIPDEIGFDYEYQNDVFDLNVEGYNVDYTKISKIVDVQKYIPTTTDFTKIINGFGGFGALLVAVLFVVLVFYFVKKLF